MAKFVHLHVHSHYSLLDGLATPEQLVKRAAVNNCAAVRNEAGVLPYCFWIGCVEYMIECKPACELSAIRLATHADFTLQWFDFVDCTSLCFIVENAFAVRLAAALQFWSVNFFVEYFQRFEIFLFEFIFGDSQMFCDDWYVAID